MYRSERPRTSPRSSRAENFDMYRLERRAWQPHAEPTIDGGVLGVRPSSSSPMMAPAVAKVCLNEKEYGDYGRGKDGHGQSAASARSAPWRPFGRGISTLWDADLLPRADVGPSALGSLSTPRSVSGDTGRYGPPRVGWRGRRLAVRDPRRILGWCGVHDRRPVRRRQNPGRRFGRRRITGSDAAFRFCDRLTARAGNRSASEITGRRVPVVSVLR